MKTTFLIAFSVFFTTILFCVPIPQDKGDNANKGVVAINARVRLAPLINKSNIASLEGWPDDSLQRMIIMRRFDKIEEKLLSELRRCEKYGLYTMVEDSNEAGMTITVTLMPFSRDYDTVTIPVTVEIQSAVPRASYGYTFNPRVYTDRETREKNSFHYVGLIMMNCVNDFPYKAIAHLLYRSEK
jgi:hypothetical protein